MSPLRRTDHHTYCPYKGDCAYYSIPLGGDGSVNAVVDSREPVCSRRRDQGSRCLLIRIVSMRLRSASEGLHR